MRHDQNYIVEIEQILHQTGWSQSRFAQELGVTFATVNRWLNGHAHPHKSQCKNIQRLFKEIVGIAPLSQKELKKQFALVDQKQKTYPNIIQLLKERSITEDFLLEMTYHSDAIEGSTLSKKQTEIVIFDKGVIKNKTLIEHLEAAHHAAILEEILGGNVNRPITEDLVKQLHYALMHGIRLDAGDYAALKRGIRGVNLVLPHPEDIPEEMDRFLSKVNEVKGHPIDHIARMHADFEAIHPFGDGNGRVGRFIMNIQLLNAGYAPCIVSVENKERYYECLEFAQKKSPTHLTALIAEAVLEGYRIIEKYV